MTNRKIVVFSEGAFGRAAAAGLARRTLVEEHPLAASRGDYAGRVDGADFVALASWRRYDPLAEEVGAACARVGLPWSSVFLSDQHLFCGPLVVPPAPPCYRCFSRRHLAHQLTPDVDRAVSRQYDGHAALGVEGFLPPAAEMAAAALAEDARSPLPGRVRRIDLLTTELVDTRVVPLHDCPLCAGDAPRDRTRRFVHHLVPALRGILR
ncbi:MAG TPA: TOMM precursor leader peptide-binding protein [Longimicrobium sp.]|nr:TOMM precursor leader peptide-binding protein [Longimicrobium sp.]